MLKNLLVLCVSGKVRKQLLFVILNSRRYGVASTLGVFQDLLKRFRNKFGMTEEKEREVTEMTEQKSLQFVDPEMHALHAAGTDGFGAVDVAVVGLEQRRVEASKKPEAGEQKVVFVASNSVSREAKPVQTSSRPVEYFLRTNE